MCSSPAAPNINGAAGTAGSVVPPAQASRSFCTGDSRSDFPKASEPWILSGCARKSVIPFASSQIQQQQHSRQDHQLDVRCESSPVKLNELYRFHINVLPIDWRARKRAVDPVEQLLLTLTMGMPRMPSSYTARFPLVDSPNTYPTSPSSKPHK